MPNQNGGAAFPRPIGHNGLSHAEEHEASDAQAGMSLRDYFAVHAPDPGATTGGTRRRDETLHDWAERRAAVAYAYADAMLRERAK